MNDHDLDQMLQRAAAAVPTTLPAALEDTIMARVRSDDGRARRCRTFVQWLLVLAAFSGIVTACLIGWLKASRDTTHTRPPSMSLFREAPPQ